MKLTNVVCVYIITGGAAYVRFFLFSCLFNGIEEKKADDEGENFELEPEGCW